MFWLTRQFGWLLVAASFCAVGCQSPMLQPRQPGPRTDPYSPRYPLPGTPPTGTADPQQLQPPQISYSPVQQPPGQQPQPNQPPQGQFPPNQPGQRPFIPGQGQPGQFQPGRPPFAQEPPQQPQPPPEQLFEPGQIVAIVGEQYVLAGDVAPVVNLTLQPFLDKAKNDAEREAIEGQKKILARQMTRHLIDTKLMYQEFLRKVPRDKLKDVQAKMRDGFDKSLNDSRKKLDLLTDEEDIQDFIRQDPTLGRLCMMMKENNIESYRELDLLLRKYDSSLDKQQKFFAEYQLGRSVVFQAIKKDPEITHEMLLKHFQEHAAEFDIPAKARFEAITVQIAKFSDEAEAAHALGRMGNEVFFGANFQEVAKRGSQGLDAERGGLHDWTTKGSLASDAMDRAVFSLPIGKLSPILKDDKALHIVRVIERQDAGRIPFEEAQDKVRKQIKREIQEKEHRTVVENLKSKTSVWTIYDAEEAQLAERQGKQPQR